MALDLSSDTKRLLCLATLLGIYLLSGAAVFQVLENENDKLEIQQLNSVKKFFLERHNMTPEDFDFLVEKVENAVKHRCGGDPDQWCTSRWTYYASVYFTWSVVTTVGKFLVSTQYQLQLYFFCIFDNAVQLTNYKFSNRYSLVSNPRE